MWSGRVGVVVSEFFDKEFIFFLKGGGVFFYKLTRNPNLTKTYFFLGGGIKGGERVSDVHEQMFQMAILLFKENTCAKLF